VNALGRAIIAGMSAGSFCMSPSIVATIGAAAHSTPAMTAAL